MKVISVVARKGGTGKTTTAHAIIAGLIRRGKSVLAVDLDSQGNLSRTIGADTGKPGALDAMTGKASPEDALQTVDGVGILAASPDMAGADMTITGRGKEYRLSKALEGFGTRFDYAVIDTPASLGILTVNALTASQRAVIVANADLYSLEGLVQLRGIIDAVRTKNNDLEVDGILLTRYRGNTLLARDMRENFAEVADKLGMQLYPQPIRECIAISEAQTMGTDIFSYSPRSNGAKDYGELLKVICTD